MSVKRFLPALCAGALATTSAFAQNADRIRLNQVGYAIGQPKLAVSLDLSDAAALVDASSGAVVLPLVPGPVGTWNYGGLPMDTTRLLDFTGFDVPGTYRIKVGTSLSHPIRISARPYEELTKGSIKALWYNRCSFALPTLYAGPWARTAGHPDNEVIIHPSAASSKRPAGSTIKSPGGWYDAGDYGKYVVNSGISTWTLLHLYESSPAYFDTLQLWVPTRSAIRSDLVDEILWNLRWMLTMQDPEDGGVYHKLTTLNFNAIEMPAQDQAERYVYQKSTAASLNLAAVAAYASRLFQRSPSLRPLADSCLKASLAAWGWARANPKTYYNQGTINSRFPDLPVVTGTYGDNNVNDERYWAAAELFLTTQADSFASVDTLAKKLQAAKWGTPSWSSTATLGWLSLQANPRLLTGSLAGLSQSIDSMLLLSVKSIRDFRKLNSYNLILNNFTWGSNSFDANNAILLWKAWKASGDTSYRNASLDGLDYLLGRNATGYSFVTGFGSRTPMYPHHRPSGADRVAAPVPGFLVGGPNASAYESDKAKGYIDINFAPKQWTDNQESYAANEVTINWNAPLAYLAGVWSDYLASPAATGIATRGGRAEEKLRASSHQGLITATASAEMVQLELLSLDGSRIAVTTGRGHTLQLRTPARGLFLLRSKDLNGQRSSTRILLP